MKTIITIATLVASSSVLAEYHNDAYDWNNDAVEPEQAVVLTSNEVIELQEKVSYAYLQQDNGVFGYNPYNVMDPRWMMEEMDNFMD
ncbi:MAG: hypothetical protein HOD55_01735 [Candidatus Thioglobus sp.]|nr:hypothetical protein [Candidatus Thioglobus sp.]